jgi:putative ABC transport system permease protein
MLHTYVKIAWRNLTRNKTLSVINILGLSLGMTFAILVGLWIHFEQSFEDFQVNKDHIAIVGRHLMLNNDKGTALNAMLPLADELKNNYPEIKHLTRLGGGSKHSLVVGDKKFSKAGLWIDPDFLNMFTFPVLKGNAKTALADPNSIVITESVAKAMFGDENPIGKQIRLDNQYTVQVSAVLKDLPKNTEVTFEFLAPYAFKIQNEPDTKNSLTNWGNSFLTIIIETNKGVSMAALSKKLEPLLATKPTGVKSMRLFLFPMSRWHLYDDFKDWVNTGGEIEYIRLFALIGGFVLLIACINFMNLSTARSEKRAKEVGIRKTIGSGRGQLITQFLTESLVTSFLAFLLSLVFIQIFLPYLKDLGFENIHFDLGNFGLLASILVVTLITGLIAGSYPAFYLSSFRPVMVLKGVIRQGKEAVNFRKILVVSQFSLSMGLIISTIIIFQQIGHAKNRPLGYSPDNLISLNATDDLRKNFPALKQDLLNTGLIDAVARSSSDMTWINNNYTAFHWTGQDPNKDASIDVIMTEFDYDKAARLQFVAGRPFSREYSTDSQAVILNEAAIRLIGYKDPIGKTMRLGDQPLTIIGVIRNVVSRDPFKPVGACAILFNPNNVNSVLIRLKDHADLRKSLAAMKPIVEKYNPALPFEYFFEDEEFGKKFATENQVGKLAGIFAGLAIFISCLGLFGLAMFMAERRSKEVSIRKVLGASVANLWLLLSKEFIWLVGIAIAIASPLAWLLMNNWLKKYDYRIDIGWPVFAIAGFLALAVALVTVSTQAIRAATANPAKTLKTE